MDIVIDYQADTWQAIAQHVEHGSVYKTLCLISKASSTGAKAAHLDADVKFANQLMTLIDMIDRGKFLPRGFASREEFIKGIGIIFNPCVSANFALSHPDWNWYWYEISRHRCTSVSHVLLAPDKTWDWSALSDTATMEDILANPKLPWIWFQVSHNPHVTVEHIIANPDLPWDYAGLSCNVNMTMDFVLNNLKNSWTWFQLSRTVQLTIKDVIGHPELLWRWDGLTVNDGIFMKDILENPTLPWYWPALSCNINVSNQDMVTNHSLPWDWSWPARGLCSPAGDTIISDELAIFSAPEIVTMDYVLANPNITWNWIKLSLHFGINDIIANTSLPWSWPIISYRKDITIETILANIGLPWNWHQVERNPNVFADDIIAHPELKVAPSRLVTLTWKKIIELDKTINWDWSLIMQNMFSGSD